MEFVEFSRYGDTWKVPNAFYRVSIKLILKNKKDELLVLKALSDGLYELPGGGLDWGEDISSAASRELQEELALTLLRIDQSPIATEYSTHPLGYHTIKIYYLATTSGMPRDNEPHKLKHSWASKEIFKSLQMPSDEAPIQNHVDLIWPPTE